MAGNIKAFLAEMIGTFALVFLSAGAVCMDVVSGGKLGWTGTALAYGLALAAMGYAFTPLAGGHFNPAVTFALFLNRRLNALKAVFFVIAQLLGAALAGILLKAALHNSPDLAGGPPFLGGCDLNSIGFKAGTLLEAVTTFFLTSAIYSAYIDGRGGAQTGPLACGATAAVCTLAAGPLTAAALNPARAFGPAIVTGHWSHWYVYWIGPFAGACAAALLFESLFLEKKR